MEFGTEWVSATIATAWVGLVSIVMLIVYLHRRQIVRRHIAENDALTNLKNRHFLHRNFPELAVAREQSEFDIHLAAINLDGFKLINDTMGHEAGDAVLIIAARRIEQCVRKRDLVIRVGGDEFIVVLLGADDASVKETMHRIISALHAPMSIGSELTTISASIGVARHSRGQHLESLLMHADTAMYWAKKQGRNVWKAFTPQMDDERIAAADTHRRLRLAFDHGEFRLVYQPKYAAGSREMIGVEALIRWLDPQKGLRLPGEFIGIAERTGLIGPLGNWVMEEACRQIRCWFDAGCNVPVAINVSALQVRSEEMATSVRDIMAKHNIQPESLTLEITESLAIEDPVKAMQVFGALRALGVAISIDDFGTGYSSLSYLKRFPATELKIDRAFIHDISRNQQSLELVRAIIAMGHALDMRVVAEGVENEITAELLESLHCDVLQGNHLGKPMDPRDVPGLLNVL